MRPWRAVVCLTVLLASGCGGGGSEDAAPADVAVVDSHPNGDDVVVSPEVSVLPPDMGCLPGCAGRLCGDDGCGGSCGNCFTVEGAIDNSLCRPNGTCCIPSCLGMACGDNGCGGVCGQCGDDQKCTNGQCLDVCQPSCVGKVCGPDGCGGSCGTCPAGETCDGSGQCEGGGCLPDCDGKECGYDGCTGQCGSCGAGKTCQQGQCVACQPDCNGKACGSDGCGGLCGSCPSNSACKASQCECDSGFDWSPDDAACWPVCPDHATNSGVDGACQCDLGYHYNGAGTACFIDCVEGAQNDPLSGQCECGGDLVWNPEQTACWPVCPEGADYDPEAALCVCQEGMVLDSDLNQCVAPPVWCGLGGAPYAVPPAYTGDARFGRTIITTNMEPVIMDKATGLMWMGCDAGVDGYTCTEGFLSLKKPASAASYCDNSDWAGFEDWRLPTIVDLLVLTDSCLSEQYGAASFFWYFDKIKLNDTWWSSTKPEYTTCPQECFLALSRDDPADYGTQWYIQYAFASFGRRVRCVRDPSPTLEHCAEVLPGPNGERVVYLEAANRFWQGCPAGQSGSKCSTGNAEKMSRDEAVVYCDALNWGGFDDWELPDINHYLTLVDFGVLDEPLLDEELLPGTVSPSYWTLTESAEPGEGWVFDYQAGQVVGTGTELTWAVRCTRTCPGHFAGADCLDCAPGWEGDGCALLVGCESGPCFPGVDCTNIFGVGFECGACPPGFEGDGIDCTDIDGCADSPCYDGVECLDVEAPEDGFTCGDCPVDMYGDGIDCETVIVCTKAGDCGDHADCEVVGDGVTSCVCDPGYLWTDGACVGQPTGFVSGMTVATASWPWDVTVNDFNGDSAPDLGIACVLSDRVQLNLCNGIDQCSLSYDKATLDKPRGIVSGHFDWDAHADLAVAVETDDKVLIYYGDGAGSFTFGGELATGNAPRSLKLADINGDFAEDLLVGLDGTAGVTVLLGIDNGGFQAGYSVATGGHSHWDIGLADFDEDGKVDMVLPDNTGHVVKVLAGDGVGGFGEPLSLAGINGPFGVATGDLNGDDHMDIAAVGNVSDNVGLYFGDGEGSFSAPTTLAAGDGARDVLAVDFNGDGALDLAISSWGDGVIRVYYGNGDGTYQDPQLIYSVAGTLLAGPGLMEAVDFNGNGHPDIVVLLQNGNALAVLYN